MSLSANFSSIKSELEAQSLRRRLQVPEALDFCSNDYLGFSSSEELNSNYREKIKNYPLGSTGSRLIHGQNEVFVSLERSLAVRSGSEASLVFPTGYMANLALFGALGKMKPHFFSDSRNHASIIDGIRLSGSEKTIFPHNDLKALASALEASPKSKLKFVVVESIYSMQGDFAPIEELLKICEDFDAHLILDEAHATGFYGHKGSGCGEDFSDKIFARIHTGGKALGVAGAWVSGSFDLKDLMVNFSRPLIYSTGMSYPQLLLLESALEYWDKFGKEQIQAASQKIELLKSLLTKAEPDSSEKISPIYPLIIGSNQATLKMEAKLLELGFHVKAIRPPTVPTGEGLLRLTVPGQRSEAEVRNFAEALRLAQREVLT